MNFSIDQIVGFLGGIAGLVALVLQLLSQRSACKISMRFGSFSFPERSDDSGGYIHKDMPGFRINLINTGAFIAYPLRISFLVTRWSGLKRSRQLLTRLTPYKGGQAVTITQPFLPDRMIEVDFSGLNIQETLVKEFQSSKVTFHAFIEFENGKRQRSNGITIKKNQIFAPLHE